MLGAIVGDIVGSIYEFDNIRKKDFVLFSPDCFFTDDTIMTVAVFTALEKSKRGNFKKLTQNTIKQLQKYGKIYPNLSYGNLFRHWLKSKDPQGYDSFGNGSAMRVAAVAYFAETIEEVKRLSKIVTEVSHNHPEGIKGAEATAVAVWLALNGKSKKEIKSEIEKYYSLDFNYEDLKKNYSFNETCQKTVPQAIFCFLISEDFEDCLRTSVSIGGDTDTLCAISCAIAGAYYGVPEEIKNATLKFLDKRILKDYQRFEKIYDKKK